MSVVCAFFLAHLMGAVLDDPIGDVLQGQHNCKHGGVQLTTLQSKYEQLSRLDDIALKRSLKRYLTLKSQYELRRNSTPEEERREAVRKYVDAQVILARRYWLLGEQALEESGLYRGFLFFFTDDSGYIYKGSQLAWMQANGKWVLGVYDDCNLPISKHQMYEFIEGTRRTLHMMEQRKLP